MLLSLLICSLKDRQGYLERLMQILDPQLSGIEDKVEVIVELDNGERSIGAKRNALLDKAKGEYLAFIDDDDIISFCSSHCLTLSVYPG